ncbi:sn-glycerol-1-phosphate dehydrogenase [Parenemella sanctibonifatiensis]|uniref:sn-glycerol-1-phosphate dehydrogenase n=1 Tax=Parenemella sanctibonifatiensis TaxID=2016505 RepID=A0A255EX19_9ACTN|nr:sn-glycerol-1-phosphate dehydrogenase [Parenemella sanctibonifatiensis]OYN92673.1 sn-glycerol-1-phosphate dehydrogenase [Parenemella sanctibonifatiensis]
MSDLINTALESSTDTKAIVTGRGVVGRTGEVFREVFGDQSAIIVADENTWAVAGDQVKASLEAAGVTLLDPYIFPGTPTLYAGYENVTTLREALQQVDAIAVSIASGTLNDIAKLASGELGRAYMNVCTAASMDGYAAYGASITRDGFKITRDCPAPAALVADFDIMAAAPPRLTATGLGDLIEKVPGGADWLVADELGIEAVDEDVWDLVQKPLRAALSNPDGLRAGDPEAVEGLAEELLLSGLAMQAHQSSRPASGAGHNFSHQWEMEGHGLDWEPPLSHGNKVGIGAVATSAVYDLLASLDVAGVDPEARAAAWLSPEEDEARVKALQPVPAIQEAALGQSRAKYIPAEEVPARIRLIQEHWPAILERVKPQVMPAAEIADILKRVGGPYHPAQVDVDLDKMKLTYYQSQTIRARYTIMDALFELGLLEQVVETLFAPGGYWAEAEVPTEGHLHS